MIINLHITTWQGISLGATHYYAHLQDSGNNYEEIELEDTLTPRQVAALKKKHRDIYPGERDICRYTPGQKFRGFDTREAAIKAGVDSWLEHFPSGKFLVLGSSSSIAPKLILATTLNEDQDKAVKKAVAEIVERCEMLGWYDKPANDHLMDEYYNEWARLLGAEVYE